MGCSSCKISEDIDRKKESVIKKQDVNYEHSSTKSLQKEAKNGKQRRSLSFLPPLNIMGSSFGKKSSMSISRLDTPCSSYQNSPKPNIKSKELLLAMNTPSKKIISNCRKMLMPAGLLAAKIKIEDSSKNANGSQRSPPSKDSKNRRIGLVNATNSPRIVSSRAPQKLNIFGRNQFERFKFPIGKIPLTNNKTDSKIISDNCGKKNGGAFTTRNSNAINQSKGCFTSRFSRPDSTVSPVSLIKSSKVEKSDSKSLGKFSASIALLNRGNSQKIVEGLTQRKSQFMQTTKVRVPIEPKSCCNKITPRLLRIEIKNQKDDGKGDSSSNSSFGMSSSSSWKDSNYNDSMMMSSTRMINQECNTPLIKKILPSLIDLYLEQKPTFKLNIIEKTHFYTDSMIGDYKIKMLLGRGAYGKVVKAQDVKTQEYVVIVTCLFVGYQDT